MFDSRLRAIETHLESGVFPSPRLVRALARARRLHSRSREANSRPGARRDYLLRLRRLLGYLEERVESRTAPLPRGSGSDRHPLPERAVIACQLLVADGHGRAAAILAREVESRRTRARKGAAVRLAEARRALAALTERYDVRGPAQRARLRRARRFGKAGNLMAVRVEIDRMEERLAQEHRTDQRNRLLGSLVRPHPAGQPRSVDVCLLSLMKQTVIERDAAWARASIQIEPCDRQFPDFDDRRPSFNDSRPVLQVSTTPTEILDILGALAGSLRARERAAVIRQLPMWQQRSPAGPDLLRRLGPELAAEPAIVATALIAWSQHRVALAGWDFDPLVFAKCVGGVRRWGVGDLDDELAAASVRAGLKMTRQSRYQLEGLLRTAAQPSWDPDLLERLHQWAGTPGLRERLHLLRWPVQLETIVGARTRSPVPSANGRVDVADWAVRLVGTGSPATRLELEVDGSHMFSFNTDSEGRFTTSRIVLRQSRSTIQVLHSGAIAATCIACLRPYWGQRDPLTRRPLEAFQEGQIVRCPRCLSYQWRPSWEEEGCVVPGCEMQGRPFDCGSPRFYAPPPHMGRLTVNRVVRVGRMARRVLRVMD